MSYTKVALFKADYAIPGSHSEPSQTSKMVLFAKIVNDWYVSDTCAYIMQTKQWSMGGTKWSKQVTIKLFIC